MQIEPSKMHVGIFGPGLSGKTTLAIHLSKAFWQAAHIRSLVWDINKQEWGPQALVFQNEDEFERQIMIEKSCAVFIEESGSTIKRNADKIDWFTRIRHRGHKIVVSGHSGASLLPVMRDQISTLYLFRQTAERAKEWADQFTDVSLMHAQNLKRYEFLEAHLFAQTRRRILKF